VGKRKLAMADVTDNEQMSDEDRAFMQENATPAEQHAAHTPESNSTDDAEASNQAEVQVDETQEPETEAQAQDTANTPATKKIVQEYMKKVYRNGADRGAGGKALVEFAKNVVEGAQKSYLKESHAKDLYKWFKKGAEKSGTLAEAPDAVPDADIAYGQESTKGPNGVTNKSFDAQVSKLRRFIAFGNQYHDKTDAPALDILSNAIKVHIKMLGENKERLKYKSTYAALYELAGEQKKDDHGGVPMTEDEMYDFFLGKSPTEKAGIDLVKTALETVNRALKGKPASDNSSGRDPVSSAWLEEARDALRETINELDPSGKTLSAIDAKATKAEAKNIVAQFMAAKRNPPTIATTYTLITRN
jgi:hypothetical protein